MQDMTIESVILIIYIIKIQSVGKIFMIPSYI